jgi:hypothetical protein
MPKFLFINTRAANCSIYKSGQQLYQALRGSDNWALDYVEINELDLPALHAGKLVCQGLDMPDYDLYLFNYHDITMRGIEGVRSEEFHKLPGQVYTMVLEVEPNNPLSRVFSDDFDGYLVLDPTLNYDHPRFHAFPRPIAPALVADYVEPEIPVIGSFGFATQDKYFDRVVAAVAREFAEARVRINIPRATYADANDQAFDEIQRQCQAAARPGIEVEFTREFFTDQQLIEWCAANTLNCFMYDRRMPGLAAVTDQAIASGRPLLVSSNETFRHIHVYQQPYPLMTLREALETGAAAVQNMQQDWSWESCQRRLTEILFEE